MNLNSEKKYCLFTNDVETTSLWNNRLSDATGKKILEHGMPLLLDAYRQFDAKGTFFFTGYIAKKFPDIVRMVISEGHEIASHGMYHDVDKGFDILSASEQCEHLVASKKILEDICGEEVISFRAPALRVNKDTSSALMKAGYRIDSSISPQRLDMIFSFGSHDKMKWIFAPRKPYNVSDKSLARRGDLRIIEVPLSSFVFAYMGTVMRISPVINRIIRRISELEYRISGKPVVFMIHPNELIVEEIDQTKVNQRATGFLSYIIKDIIRYRLKMRNLGDPALPLLFNELQHFHDRNYEFITIKDYVNHITKI